jgi:hypothetical protein
MTLTNRAMVSGLSALLVALGLTGCSTSSPSSGAAYGIAFAAATTPPASPAAGTPLTFTMSVSDVSSTGVSGANVPFNVYVDGTLALTGVISSIPANTTITQQFTLSQLTAGTHSITVNLDPGNSTGAAGQASDTQTFALVVSNTVAAYQVGFAGATAPPVNPTTGQALLFTMEVSDISAAGDPATNFPFDVTVDGVLELSGVIPSIPANSTVSQQFTLNQQSAGTHVVVVNLDPANTTGAAGQTDDSQSITITVAQAVGN